MGAGTRQAGRRAACPLHRSPRTGLRQGTCYMLIAGARLQPHTCKGRRLEEQGPGHAGARPLQHRTPRATVTTLQKQVSPGAKGQQTVPPQTRPEGSAGAAGRESKWARVDGRGPGPGGQALCPHLRLRPRAVTPSQHELEPTLARAGGRDGPSRPGGPGQAVTTAFARAARRAAYQ